MKRDEIENLIASLHRAMMCARIGRVDDMVQLCALATLGASVAEPSEEELEIVARSLCVTKLQNPNTLLDDPCGGQSPAWRFELLAAQNLLYDLRTRTLKDRANV